MAKLEDIEPNAAAPQPPHQNATTTLVTPMQPHDYPNPQTVQQVQQHDHPKIPVQQLQQQHVYQNIPMMQQVQQHDHPNTLMMQQGQQQPYVNPQMMQPVQPNGQSFASDYSGAALMMENQDATPAPASLVGNLDVGEPWTTGLFDCLEDHKNAILTLYLPCLTFGRIAEVLDRGEMQWWLGGYIYLAMMPFLCTHWIIGSKYREKLRRKYNLVEAPYSDFVAHMFCPCCALAQEFREIRNRGLDPALGWSQLAAQEPPPTQGMTR